jgi:hypothetical protein
LSTGIQSADDDPPTQIMLLALLPFAVYLGIRTDGDRLDRTT